MNLFLEYLGAAGRLTVADLGMEPGFPSRGGGAGVSDQKAFMRRGVRRSRFLAFGIQLSSDLGRAASMLTTMVEYLTMP
jgi:hypothetical protein